MFATMGISRWYCDVYSGDKSKPVRRMGRHQEAKAGIYAAALSEGIGESGSTGVRPMVVTLPLCDDVRQNILGVCASKKDPDLKGGFARGLPFFHGHYTRRDGSPVA